MKDGDPRKILDYLEQVFPETLKQFEALKNIPKKKDVLNKLMGSALWNVTGGSSIPAFIPCLPSKTGDIYLGEILNGEIPFGSLRIDPKLLSPVFGVFGASSTGKSTGLTYGILIPTIEKTDISGLIFDPEGQYKKHLFHRFPEKVLSFKPNEFKINPLIPPAALTAQEWTNIFASFLRPLNAGDAMIGMAVNQLNSVYQDCSTPTFGMLKERIHRLSFKSTDRAYQHRASLEDRLNWLERVFGRAWDCERGYSKKDLEGKWIIIETVGLDLAISNFFQDLIMERKRYSVTKLPEEPKEIVVFEEAHFRFGGNFMTKGTEVAERVALSQIRTLRKYGFITIIVDQVPSLLAPQVTANLSSVLCFRLNNSRCVQKVSELTGLDVEESEAIPRLGDRKAVFFSHNCLPRPVLVQIPEYDVVEAYDEKVEKEVSERIKKLHFVPRQDHQEDMPGRTDSHPESSLPTTHLTVAKSFATDHFIDLSERANRYGLHNEQLDRIVKELQKMGFLGELQPYGIGRGAPAKTAFVTEAGAKLLGMEYKDCIPPGKSTSAQHRYLQRLIKEKVNGAIEFLRGDVIQYTPDGAVCYQVELDPDNDHVLVNIKTALDNFRRVVLVAKNQKDALTLKKRVREDFLELLEEGDIEIRTIEEVIKDG